MRVEAASVMNGEVGEGKFMEIRPDAVEVVVKATGYGGGQATVW